MLCIGVLCLIAAMSVGHSGLTDEAGSRSSMFDCSCDIIQQLKQKLTDDQENLAQQIKTQANQLTTAEELEHELTDKVRKLESDGTAVAFGVTKPTGKLINHRPIFSQTLVNTGSYNQSSGIFTCPIQGIYSFSASLYTVHNFTCHIYCYYQVSGASKGYIISDHDISETTSVTLVINLDVGDVVILYCEDCWDYVVVGNVGTRITGVLVIPT